MLANPPAHISGYLVYGLDVGLVHERAVGLFRKFGGSDDESFSKIRLAGDDIANDPGLLADEFFATGLFGGKRVVLVAAGSKNFLPSVEAVLADPPPESVLIVEAGNLRRDAPLRILFERGRATATVECYPDSPQELLRLVKTEAQRAGLSISDETASEFIAHLGSDRAASRSEIEKLLLYASGSGSITGRDIEAITADASALALDRAITSAFLGLRSMVTETAIRAFETGNDPGVLLGFALRHASALHRAKESMEQGAPFERAAGFLLRGQHTSTAQKAVRDQMGLWSAARLLRAIELVSEAIRKCRREPRLGQLVAIRTMWSIAQAAKARG